MKKILRVLLVLLVLVVVALVIGMVFIDRAVVAAVEKGGTYALGVETELGSADVGLGSFAMEGLSIANPPGFSNEHFVELGSARLEVKTDTILSDQIVAPLFEVRAVAVDIDRNKEGTNYGVILKNLERFESKEPKPEEQPGPSKTVLLEKVRIYDVTATVKVLPMGGEATRFTVQIPEIAVDDLDSGGMTAAEITSLLVRTILTSVLKAGKGILPEDLLKDLGAQLENVEAVALEITGEALKEVTEGLGEAGKELEKAAEDALKDVFKRDKDE